jgi:predicted methyltransferase
MATNRFSAGVAAAGVALLGGCGFHKFFTPAGWRQPERVVAALSLEPGACVADVGAGDGYFTWLLADAVGPQGRVYAVEVADGKVDALRAETARRGYQNVTVVRGEFHDPLLPDRQVDLAFFSAVFHHIENRAEYFTQLQQDLAPGGRVAIVDGAPDPFHKLLLPFHFPGAEAVSQEMTDAGYRRTQVLDFLPMLHFQVFAPGV